MIIKMIIINDNNQDDNNVDDNNHNHNNNINNSRKCQDYAYIKWEHICIALIRGKQVVVDRSWLQNWYWAHGISLIEI